MNRTMKIIAAAGALAVWLPIGFARADILFRETFEGTGFPTLNSWTTGDSEAAGPPAYWGTVNSAFGGEGTFEGNRKAYCAAVGFGGSSVSPTYQNSMRAYLQKWVDLSTYGSATLTFWYKIPSLIYGEEFRVYFGDWLLWTTRSNQPAWTLVTLNLERYTGWPDPERLKFQFYSDAGGPVAEGAYLDYISLIGYRPAADVYEPDRSSAEAKTITNGVYQSRTIHAAGNADWVKFTVGPLGARNLIVYLDHGARFREPLQTEMWLYRGSGAEVGHDLDSGRDGYSRIEVDSLAAGTYFIKVQDRGNNGVIPWYYLGASWQPIYPLDAYEPDGSTAGAKTIANGETQTRSISSPGDEDLARISIGSGGARDLVLETAGGTGKDPELYLHRGATGEQVAYDDDSGEYAFSRLTVDSLTPGTYFAKVRDKGANGTIETYTLHAAWTSGSEADAFEPDNGTADAQSIANRETQTRSIHAAGNVDWVRFVVGSRGAQNVRLETAGTSGDTQMWLYRGSTGEEVAFDDDSGAGDFSRIGLGSLTPGTYLLKIQENGNNSVIPVYRLSASWSVPL